jgi:maleylacetate reductase
MAASGRVNFGSMDAVVFGKPAAEAVAEEARRLGATRVFLMVSSTLNRNTDEIARVKAALGNAAPPSGMACRRTRLARRWLRATEQARAVGADLIVTLGGGSITDGAKAVQMCLANDIRTAAAMDALRAVKAPTAPLVRRAA